MRKLQLIGGLIVLAVGWTALALQSVRYPFALHMTVHMAVVAIAAPLFALFLAGTRFDPVRLYPSWFPPLPVSLIELAVVWLWHTPLLHAAAQRSWAALVAEQLSFLIAGLWLWLAILGGTPAGRVSRGPMGIVALLLTLMHMTLLGAILALSPRVLYPRHHHHAIIGDPLGDQQLGGAIMLLIGGIVYMCAGLRLAFIAMSRETPGEHASLVETVSPGASSCPPSGAGD